MVRLAWIPIAVLALAASACAGPPSSPASQPGDGTTPVSGGQLRWHVSDDPRDYDPSDQGRGTPGDNGLAQAYNTLLGFKSGPGVAYETMVLQPELAERWEVAPDTKSFTFHLRKGVKHADLPPVSGREFTSEDVKFSMEYYARTGEFKNNKQLVSSRLAQMYEGLEEIATPDRYTVQVRFKEPFVPFIAYAGSDWNPMAPREIYQMDGHLKDQIAGTGPYYLDAAASQKGTRWVWKKHQGYWEVGKPYLDEIRWIVLKDDASALAAFQTKQLDGVKDMLYQTAQDFERASPAAQSIKYLQAQPSFLRLSQGPGSPLTDIRLRKAVALAIDRDEIVKVITGGQGSWAMPSAMPGLFSDAEVKQLLKQDIAEARRLVAEAGHPNGLTVELPHFRATEDTDVLYQLIQAQMKRANINAEIKSVDRAVIQTRRRNGEFGLDIGTGSSTLEADPDSMLFNEYHSSLLTSGNYSKIKDQELDGMLDAQRL